MALICERLFSLVIRSLEGVQPLAFALDVGPGPTPGKTCKGQFVSPLFFHSVTTPVARTFMPSASLQHIRPSSGCPPCPDPEDKMATVQAREINLAEPRHMLVTLLGALHILHSFDFNAYFSGTDFLHIYNF